MDFQLVTPSVRHPSLRPHCSTRPFYRTKVGSFSSTSGLSALESILKQLQQHILVKNNVRNYVQMKVLKIIILKSHFYRFPWSLPVVGSIRSFKRVPHLRLLIPVRIIASKPDFRIQSIILRIPRGNTSSKSSYKYSQTLTLGQKSGPYKSKHFVQASLI